MQPLFEADTVITFEAYEKFGKALARRNKRVIVYWLFVGAIWLVMAGACYAQGSMRAALVMLLVALAFPFITKFRMKRARRRAWESNKMLHDVCAHYAFYEDYVEQSSKLGTTRYEYKLLHRVIETADAFYLLASTNQGLIIDKKSCSEELCAFIRKIT